MTSNLRLGINIDHVATLRNARGGAHPCPVAAARLAAESGADGITAHLREDRRHIRDDDMRRLKAEVNLPLNFEMAATDEMLAIALAIKPNACCLVPEKREERTTEGGLDVAGNQQFVRTFIQQLKGAKTGGSGSERSENGKGQNERESDAATGIRVSLFIDSHENQVWAAAQVGADIVELHTGTYAGIGNQGSEIREELKKIQNAATLAHSLGLEVHAGHGLTFENVGAIAAIPELVELNIGHFIIGQAVFSGLPEVIKKMREIMDDAR